MAYEYLIPFAAIPLRVIVGLVMMAHGRPKLTKKGFKAHASFLRKMKFRNPSPKFWAFCSAFAEFFGGLAILIGAFTRIGAALIAINMLVAVYVHKTKFNSVFVAKENSYEYPLLIAAAAITLILLGAGALSVDMMYSLPFA